MTASHWHSRTAVGVAAGFALLLLSGLRATIAQSPEIVAFTNVTVVAMDANRITPNQHVVVSKGRITAAGPAASTAIPAAAVRVDGRGKFVMPGLAEMHGHVPAAPQPKSLIDDVLFLYVANGVTTVRGMLGAPDHLALRDAARRGEVLAPNLYLAGPSFSGNSTPTPDAAIARVRQQKAEGWDLLKVHPGLSLATFDAMAKTAKEVGIRFAGHVPADVGVPHALEMGQDTIDHVDGYAEFLDGRRKPVDEAGVQDLVARTKKAGTGIVPTLYVWETLQAPVTLESRTSLPELRYLPRTIVEQWTKGLDSRLKNPQFNAAEAKLYIENRMRIMQALYKGGVTILLGSDAPQQFNVPGFSIYREMERMAAAGMSTFDILASGTANVGVYFRGWDDFGTIAVGKRADLMLLDANPLESLANLERRAGVMVRGRWLPASEIRTRLDEIAARLARPVD
jgi:cytosine/adenosine deaminase-related metal-dependent hydrolase